MLKHLMLLRLVKYCLIFFEGSSEEELHDQVSLEAFEGKFVLVGLGELLLLGCEEGHS